MTLKRRPMKKKTYFTSLGAEKLAKCEKFCDDGRLRELRESLVSSFWYVVYSALVVPGSAQYYVLP